MHIYCLSEGVNPFPRRRPGTWGRPQGYLFWQLLPRTTGREEKTLLFQIYDYYRTVYGSEKGQDLIEYALLLALIVAVGILIYQQSGLKDSLVTIFTNANTVAKTAAIVSNG